ncbi:MAG: hypothetical protein FWF82_06670, partial [Oscillospiraceae bacterium]|nr:hypothetical protein [Oscillospiraceae bacterium]
MKKRIISLILTAALLISLNPLAPIDTPTAAEPVEEIIFTHKGTTEASGEANGDIFPIILDKPGRVSLSLAFSESASYSYRWTAVLKDKLGNTIKSIDITGDAVRSTTTNAYLSADTYSLTVYYSGSYFSSTPDYIVDVNYLENVGQFEIEPNDTQETASSIALNSKITGSMNTSGDIDFYKIELEKPGRVVLNFTHSTGSNSNILWKMHFQKADGTIIRSTDLKNDLANIPENERVNHYLDAGVYYIRIVSNGASYWTQRDYTISVDYTQNDGQFEIEPNNTRETASPFKINSSITGNLSAQSDIDFYEIELKQPGRLVLNLTRPASSSNTNTLWNIEVHKHDGTLITTAALPGNLPTISENMRNVHYLDKGIYYVRVSGGTGNNWSNADYTLESVFTPNTGAWEIEPNDTPDKATLIEVNKMIIGNLSNVTDMDWYSFIITEPSTATVT